MFPSNHLLHVRKSFMEKKKIVMTFLQICQTMTPSISFVGHIVRMKVLKVGKSKRFNLTHQMEYFPSGLHWFHLLFRQITFRKKAYC